MRRALAVIASAALGLALLTGVARAASAYQQVLQVYEREGSIPPCQFAPVQLQAALGGVDTYGAQYFADFTQAVQAALSARAGGACTVATSVADGGRAAPNSGGYIRAPPGGALTAASSAGLPWPLALLGGLTLAGAVALAGARLVRLRRQRGASA